MSNSNEESDLKDFPETFLSNIALTFSGGGFRASAYCLGVLSFLNHFKLPGQEEKSILENVKGLSTVSGGTITGAKYAVSLAEEKEFDTFYKEMLDFMKGERFLDNALKKLENEQVWKENYKRRSLINALSLTYHEMLTDQNFKAIMQKSGHLEDICFNATEMSTGVAFRFQINGDFGNYNLKKILNSEERREAFKISDAVASSSCFPLGFAPLLMPDDYLDPKTKVYKDLKRDINSDKDSVLKDPMGILDGGIVDNQGIGSTILAHKRRKKDESKKPYDLILVCDVANYKMDPWQPSDTILGSKYSLQFYVQKFKTWMKKNFLGMLFFAGSAASIYYALTSNLSCCSKWLMFLGGFLALLGILVYAVKLIMKLGVWYLKYKAEKIIPKFFLNKIQFFDDLSTRLLRRMMIERITSGISMVNQVFLKQIRRLNFHLLYGDPELKNRRAAALIYKLTRDQFKGSKSNEYETTKTEDQFYDEKKYGGLPEEIADIAEKAANMETTLWFTKEHEKEKMLKMLVVCGQFTTCYTLLNYVNGIKNDQVSYKDEIQRVKSKLETEWKEFIKDPYRLYQDF